MRRFLLFAMAAIGCAWASASGYVLSKDCNMPRGGDEFAMQRVEFLSPGDGGENRIWDFSSVGVVDADYRIRYEVEGDSIVTITKNRTAYSYRMVGDTLLWAGYENRLTCMRDSAAALSMLFPMGFGQELSREFYFKGLYSQTKEIAAAGRAVIAVDGKGMLYLPAGDTLRSVLRLKRVYDSKVKIFKYGDSLAATVDNDSLLRHIETIHSWYAEGYRYPVAETIEHVYRSGEKVLSRFRSAFICPPSEQTFSGLDEENAAVRAKMLYDPQQNSESDYDSESDANVSLAKVSLATYGTEVTISIDNIGINADVELILTDVAGRVYDSIPRRRASGCYIETIPITSLPNGEYVLYVNIGGEISSVTFSKK